MEKGFLITYNKDECFGCEACVQVCGHGALKMVEDNEGFRYPSQDIHKCINCSLCHTVCPVENPSLKNKDTQIAFGGYCLNQVIREQSTSGGAFSAIVDAWCDENYVIFGAVADGLEVHHSYITDKSLLQSFRKSKYSQSIIGHTYKRVNGFLREGRKVIFSGTPCQIGGLLSYLKTLKCDITRLLTVEVVCEGVPSPLYVRKLDEHMLSKYGSRISSIDYRYKNKSSWYFGSMKFGKKSHCKWDFEVMKFFLRGGGYFKIDRWFNPFWSIWLQHLMSRPSCYECPFTTQNRIADVTLGDLWGVHIYCPELYGHNGGSSIVVANSTKGKEALVLAKSKMYGHKLDMKNVIKYQGPMRSAIGMNPQRAECMADLENQNMSYTQINRKWAKRPTLKLLIQKYIWGNSRKVWWWNFKRKFNK